MKKNFSIFNPLTYDGAYILGLICSDGHVEHSTVEIIRNKNAGRVLFHIARLIFGEEDAVKEVGNEFVLTIENKEFAEYVRCSGGISSSRSSIFDLQSSVFWSFICGYFEGRAGEFKYDYQYPEIWIASHSQRLLEHIAAYWNVDYKGEDTLSASGYKALDICGKMYENVSLRQSRKYHYFMDILNWEPSPGSPWLRENCFKCKKLDKKAIIPTKKRVTDSGYDIYAVEIDYDSDTGLYTADTRLAVEPIPGYYFDMVGRSSLPASGFCFVGGVGIIDRSYVGSLKMKLLKFNKNAPLPSMPFRCGQLIPRRIIHLDFVETDQLSDSDRGEGGFGSSEI